MAYKEPTDLAAATGVLDETNGGTGQSTITTGDLLYGSASNTLSKLGIGSSNQVLKVSGGIPAWGAAAQGGINYISANPDAESDAASWTTYDDAAATPVDLTGGSFGGTFARTTTTPLRGAGSFLYTPGSIGEGVAFTITPDLADYGQVLEFGFDFDYVSATAATGDYTVWVYDVTNSTLIQPAGYQVPGATTGIYGKFKCTFQTSMTGVTYRIAIHQAASTSAAIEFDNVYCGPQIKAVGPFISDWVSYTPTYNYTTTGSGATNNGRWRRVGDTMVVQFDISFGTSPSFSNNFSANPPTGYSIDTSKIASGNTSVVGSGYFYDASTSTRYVITPILASGNICWHTSQNASGVIQNTIPVTLAGGDQITATFEVPITGWSSGMLLSSDSGDSRVVAALYTGGGPTGTLTNSYNAVTFGTKVLDTHSGLSGSVYTIQVPGVYQISAGTAQSATYSVGKIAVLSIWVDGNQCETAIVSAGGAQSTLYPTVTSMARYYTAGQQITIKSYNDATTPTFGSSTTQNWFSINRSGGNQTLAASESVSCSFTNTAGTAVGAEAALSFPTKNYDTHGAFVTDTFTAPVAGKYHVSANINFNTVSHTAGEYILISIFANGSRAHSVQWTAPSTMALYNGFCISGTVSLLAGQTIQLKVRHDKGGNLITSSGHNGISIEKVGN